MKEALYRGKKKDRKLKGNKVNLKESKNRKIKIWKRSNSFWIKRRGREKIKILKSKKLPKLFLKSIFLSNIFNWKAVEDKSL